MIGTSGRCLDYFQIVNFGPGEMIWLDGLMDVAARVYVVRRGVVSRVDASERNLNCSRC